MSLRPRNPRTIDSWAARRTGKPAGRVTTSDILRDIPPASGLRYRSRLTGSPLGGRIAPHLRHLEDEEALELLSRAEAFLASTLPDAAAEHQRSERDDLLHDAQAHCPDQSASAGDGDTAPTP